MALRIIDKVESYIFDGEYILLGEDGANLISRSTSLAFKASGKFWVNNHAHIIKQKTGTTDYWTHRLEEVDYRIWVSGSAQPKLTADALNNIVVSCPEVEQQKEIAEYLDQKCSEIDTITEKIRHQIELYKEYRTTLIAEVVTGKIKVTD